MAIMMMVCNDHVVKLQDTYHERAGNKPSSKSRREQRTHQETQSLSPVFESHMTSAQEVISAS